MLSPLHWHFLPRIAGQIKHRLQSAGEEDWTGRLWGHSGTATAFPIEPAGCLFSELSVYLRRVVRKEEKRKERAAGGSGEGISHGTEGRRKVRRF